MSIMIVTEKPSACKKISKLLDEKNSPKRINLKNVEYYRVKRGKKSLLVVPAIGHLFTVSHKKIEGQKGFQYPVFDLIWIPIHEKMKQSRKKNKQYYQNKNILDVIKKVSQVCTEYIVACDYDIEGSTIGYKILEYCVGENGVKLAKRMKFSSLTDEEISNSFENPLNTLDFNLVSSGLCRHEVDYLFGINLTHALTHSTTQLDRINFYLLSTGRVQGPTLAEIVKRERQINSFTPKKYWVIDGFIRYKGKKYPISHSKRRFFKESTIDKILTDCKGKSGKISDIKTKKILRYPPIPYNLSGLQDDAYNYFKYNPSYTLRIAEKLYLDSLISYPRTSNQVIPKEINLKKIIKSLMKSRSYKKYGELLSGEKLVPSKGKKRDPAHPPILPTGNLPEKKLKTTEKKIFNLVVYRFFSIFGEPAEYKRKRYIISLGKEHFYLSGKTLTKKGWLELNPLMMKKVKSQQIPSFKMNQGVDVNLNKEDKETRPPPRYNPNSIRKWMERQKIGTKATRSDIVKKLYQRKYINGNRISPTEIGNSLIKVLEKYVPEILSIEMTRDLETKMERIEKGELKKSKVIDSVKNDLKKILDKFKEDEDKIGQGLEDSIIKMYENQNIIGECPNCDGQLKIFYSKKTKKRFIGCTNYPKCTTSFPVAQKGKITPLNKECKYCKDKYQKAYPLFKLNLPSKRPFTTCVNWNKHEKRSKKTKK
ncbi:MAG: DNA topoisomerase I [Candidatus Lokiarchaeota archaeon]|nr:DNA topoisomerase I [Candidatus Lokiarchaeota archaeon]